MVYSTIAHYTKEAAHWTIENTFPSTPLIATLSGAAGWYAHEATLSFSPNYYNTIIINTFGSTAGRFLGNRVGEIIGYLAVPFITPKASPETAKYVGLGVTCATSFSLNMLAKGFFRMRKCWNPKSVTDRTKPLTDQPDPTTKLFNETIKSKEENEAIKRRAKIREEARRKIAAERIQKINNHHEKILPKVCFWRLCQA